ncbi:ATP-binding protein, partial [Bifidobacterium longum]
MNTYTVRFRSCGRRSAIGSPPTTRPRSRNQLQSCSFIEQRLNILPAGATGSGKSWLACAIVRQACRQSYRSLYTRMPDLAEQLDCVLASWRPLCERC